MNGTEGWRSLGPGVLTMTVGVGGVDGICRQLFYASLWEYSYSVYRARVGERVVFYTGSHHVAAWIHAATVPAADRVANLDMIES